MAVQQLGHRVSEILTDPGFDLVPTQPGVQINPRVLATSLEGPLSELDAALRELHDSESMTRHTQSLKDAALLEAEVFEGNVARYYEALYVLAGEERLAARLRRSSHVRPGGGTPGSEEPADDRDETDETDETDEAEAATEETTEEANA